MTTSYNDNSSVLTVQPSLVLLTQQPLFSEDADNKTRLASVSVCPYSMMGTNATDQLYSNGSVQSIDVVVN